MNEIDRKKESAMIRQIHDFYDGCKKEGLTTEEIINPVLFEERILAYIDEKLGLLVKS